MSGGILSESICFCIGVRDDLPYSTAIRFQLIPSERDCRVAAILNPLAGIASGTIGVQVSILSSGERVGIGKDNRDKEKNLRSKYLVLLACVHMLCAGTSLGCAINVFGFKVAVGGSEVKTDCKKDGHCESVTKGGEIGGEMLSFVLQLVDAIPGVELGQSRAEPAIEPVHHTHPKLDEGVTLEHIESREEPEGPVWWLDSDTFGTVTDPGIVPTASN